LESFQGAALSLVFLAPGLILISFPSIRWWGIFTLAGLGLFTGFMFFNLVSIGIGELQRARRMRDPATAAAAKEYKAALAQWRKDAPQLPVTQPRMALERAEMIVREYILALSHDSQPRPMLRPLSQLPFSKAEIRLAFKIIFPTLDPEQETMLKYAYAALAHFIPDEDFAWVEEVWRARQARIEGAASPADAAGVAHSSLSASGGPTDPQQALRPRPRAPIGALEPAHSQSRESVARPPHTDLAQVTARDHLPNRRPPASLTQPTG